MRWPAGRGGALRAWQNPFRGWNRNFALLAAGVFSVGAFFGIQLTLFNNFIVDRLGIEAHQLGVVEAIREIPGFLNILFIALMIYVAASLAGGWALVVMGLGIMAYVKVDSIFTLGLFSLVWSLAFHSWVPLQQTMALRFSPPGDKGKWLGQLRSIGSLAWLLAIVACKLLLDAVGYEGMFVLAGAVTVLGGVAVLNAARDKPPVEPQRFVCKRRYGLYYALNFLQGCRKQMFITFAIFALVKVHGMPVTTTITLVLINQTLITLTSPLMGRLVDRFGERAMLSASYVGLAFIFVGYAVVKHLPSLYTLYCLDNLIFFGGMAITTYAHKIVAPEDLTPTLSMGVTMNHVAAVAAPLVGGFVWQKYGYQVIFYSGAVMALISLVVCQWINPSQAHADDDNES